MEANWLPAPKGAFNLTMRLLQSEVGGADRKIEITAGCEVANDGGDIRPMKADDTSALPGAGVSLPAALPHSGQKPKPIPGEETLKC